jgi:hypothetical protein
MNEKVTIRVTDTGTETTGYGENERPIGWTIEGEFTVKSEVIEDGEPTVKRDRFRSKIVLPVGVIPPRVGDELTITIEGGS